METFEVVSCPTTELSYTNRAILNPGDPFSKFEHIAVRYPKRNEAFVFSVIAAREVELGKIAFNLSGRKWASLMVQKTIEAAPYKFEPRSQCLNSITFTIDFTNRQTAPTNLDFNTDEMAKQFSEQFVNQAFTVGQLFAFVFMHSSKKKVIFELKVKELAAINIEDGTSNVEIGLTTANTLAMFQAAPSSGIVLSGGMTGSAAAPKIFNQDWDFANMGVGGLKEQFNKIFRRAFASRLLPPLYAQKIGIEHVRGILLYGPPGTGKTLIARQIGKMLLAREPKIVNGPEVLNKFVGESEANIRKLFADAEEEQAKMGSNSGLHIIIFDEIDAICKARGASASSSGVGDNVVNQLLSKIDGVDSLHNVLLIGMTNRRDLIDDALLRPGRLEVQIEIGLPNCHGRLEIFKIHTRKMREAGVLDSSVNLNELAEKTKNYTGAEIAGLIKAATSIANSRLIQPDVKVKLDKDLLDQIKVTRQDFEYAMTHDIKPALGASEDKLKELARPIIQWDPEIYSIQSTLSKIVSRVSNPDNEEQLPYCVLLVGQPGSGLTTLAVNMAAKTDFPFIRVYEPIATSEMTESAKVQYMKKLFNDASRSESSCIVITDLDLMMDYSNHGPTYSKTSRSQFLSILKSVLPENHRMLIICGCSYEPFVNDLRLRKAFRRIIRVPPLTKPEHVQTYLNYHKESGDSPFDKEQIEELVDALYTISFKMGIKELEGLLKDMSEYEYSERVDAFIKLMRDQGLIL